MGIMTALAIAIHNFPPRRIGHLCCRADRPALGIAIAVAIASTTSRRHRRLRPDFLCHGSRNKAFVYSFLSGLSEPLGAMVGFGLLFLFFNEIVWACSLPRSPEYGVHFPRRTAPGCTRVRRTPPVHLRRRRRHGRHGRKPGHVRVETKKQNSGQMMLIFGMPLPIIQS